ncbi:hypothetical protein D3C73_924360 [compost metagenome]
MAGSEALPASSVATTVSNWPLFCAGLNVTLKVPSSVAWTVPTMMLSGPRTVMVLPGSALPISSVPAWSSSKSAGCAGGTKSGAVTSNGAEGLPVTS